MLVLCRKLGEQIVIGQDVVVTVVGICGDRVRLGISAPASVPIHRREIFDRIRHGGSVPPLQRSTGLPLLKPCG